MESKKNEQNDESFSIPMMNDETSMGEVKINHSVIANIANLSALATEGVLAVGKHGIANGIASFFSSRKSTGNGVNVSEDEFGNYIIDICVTVKFGTQLTKVASEIQQNITKNITHMTTTGVSRVNVVIDGVETEETKQAE